MANAWEIYTSGKNKPTPASSSATKTAREAWEIARNTLKEPLKSPVQAETPISSAPIKSDGSRFGNWLGGTIQSAGSGFASAFGTLGQATARTGVTTTNAEISEYESRLAEAQAALSRESDPMMREARKQAVQQYTTLLEQAKARLPQELETQAELQATATKAQDTANLWAKSAEEKLNAAKEGVGGVGRFLMDAGTAGVQLAGDIALNALLPGAGLASMGVRSFGSAAQQARNAGATEIEQWGYGLGSAAASVLTERLANIGVFKKLGKGVLDDALKKVTAKRGGAIAVSALSEAGEELAEALSDPILRKLTYDPNAAYDSDWLAETLYSMGIGGVLGGAGGAVDVNYGRNAAGKGAETQIAESATKDTAKEKAPQNAKKAGIGEAAVLQDASLGGTLETADPRVTTAKELKAAGATNSAIFSKTGLIIMANGNVQDGIGGPIIGSVNDGNGSNRYPVSDNGAVPGARIAPVSGNDGRGNRGQGMENLRRSGEDSPRAKFDALTAQQQAAVIETIKTHLSEKGMTPEVMMLSAEDGGLDDFARQFYGLYEFGRASAEDWSALIRDVDGLVDKLDDVTGHNADGLGAADLGFDPYSNLQNQTSRFHPEGAYAARPVDVPTTNFDGRNVPKSASTVMGAQGIDESDVRFIEKQIAEGKIAFDTIRDTDAVARAQAVIQEKRFDGALEQYRQAVAGNVATKDNTALGQQLLLQAMREGNTANVAELLTLYTRNSTTAAQAMQAQSIFRKLSPEGQLVAVQKAVNALNTKYGTDAQLTQEEVADFLNAETAEARAEVERRIVKRVAQHVPGTFRAKYDTLRYLAMLGNFRTHIRNILGNTLFQIPVAVKNRAGAIVEAAAYAKSGGKTERTKALFGVNPMGKLAAEARADWVNAKDFLEQSSKYNEAQASLSAIEQQADAFSNDNFVGRSINKLSDLNSRALAAEDTAAKKWIYTQSLAGYLKANGCNSISDADPTLLNNARNYAAQEALRNTFNDRNDISDAVSKLGALSRSDNKAMQFAGYIAEGVLPFKRTPANIAVRAVEYSPVGAVLGAVETIRGAKSGDMARVSVGLDRIAAGVSGTALLAAGFLAAGAGYVTGGEGEDEKQQSFDDLTGHQNYALELKDSTSVTLDWLAPEAIPFFMGVELYSSMLDGGISWDEAWETVKNAASPMLEMSMLQGLNDTFENAAYAKNRGDSVLGSLLTSALTNYATQIFPTLSGQIERSSEDMRMTTYTEKDGNLPTDIQYTLGKVSQKIPVWDYQQIPYIDAWGQTEPTGDVMERAANNLFNPAYVSQIDVDAVEQELQRLYDAVGGDYGTVFPERAKRYINDAEGNRKDFTADEYVKYAKDLGKTSYSMIRDAISTESYSGMNDAQKAEYLDSVYQYARASSNSRAGGKPLEGYQLNASNAQKDLGVSTAQFIAWYGLYGSELFSGKAYEKTKQAVKAGIDIADYAKMKQGVDADGNGSVTQEEAQWYLDNQNFSRSEKDTLWNLINTSWKKNPYK